MSTATNTRVSTQTKFKALEVKVPSELASFAKKFDPVILQVDDTPVPPNNSDYFADMDITNNIELDNGDKCILDVQPDFKYIMSYIFYHVVSQSAEWNLKGHPYLSPISYVGYCMTIVYAHFLACDIYYRKPQSYAASRINSDPMMKDLFKSMLSLHVPRFLADLLLEIAPVNDPRRPGLKFVPTLNGYSHLHDFGRTPPPHIFYACHDILASTRSNSEPADVLARIYRTHVFTSGAQQFTIANYFGTGFDNNLTRNTFLDDFETLMNPLIGRILSARPTYARIPFTVETLSNAPARPGLTPNTIYSSLLLMSRANIAQSTKTYQALSTFTLAIESNAPKLGNVLATLSGSLLLSHTIEPPTLPTFTALKTNLDTDAKNHKNMTVEEFATAHGFLPGTEPSSSSHDITYDGKFGIPNLLLMKKRKHNDDSPIAYVKFDEYTHVHPDVFVFQPYDVSASSAGLTIAAGFKIEVAEIDSFAVPLPNADMSLFENNSMFLNSAIRLDQITAIFSHETVTSPRLSLVQRTSHHLGSNPVMASIISMAKAVLPIFDNEGITFDHSSGWHSTTGITVEDQHIEVNAAFNVKAGTNGKFGLGKPNGFYGWSSYRHVHTQGLPSPADISFILSFRTIYGTNVTLSRLRNPQLIIPHH